MSTWPANASCQCLVRALLDGISSRFGTVFDDTKVQLSSALHSKLKLDWVENQVQKSLVVDQMKWTVEIEHRSKEKQQDCLTAFARESHQDQTQVTAAVPTANDFFARITSKRNATVARPDADAEVESYLSTELWFLEAYPNICQVYLKLNIGLPSSAAIERLFSLGGRVFSPLRSRLSSECFEMFLRTAANGETFVYLWVMANHYPCRDSSYGHLVA